MYVDCAIPFERISKVQEKLMCNALRLANKLTKNGVYITAVQMARTKTIYIMGTNFRLRIANHKAHYAHRNIKKLTIELERGVMLTEEFDDDCDEYAMDIAREIERRLLVRQVLE